MKNLRSLISYALLVSYTPTYAFNCEQLLSMGWKNSTSRTPIRVVEGWSHSVWNGVTDWWSSLRHGPKISYEKFHELKRAEVERIRAQGLNVKFMLENPPNSVEGWLARAEAYQEARVPEERFAIGGGFNEAPKKVRKQMLEVSRKVFGDQSMNVFGLVQFRKSANLLLPTLHELSELARTMYIFKHSDVVTFGHLWNSGSAWKSALEATEHRFQMATYIKGSISSAAELGLAVDQNFLARNFDRVFRGVVLAFKLDLPESRMLDVLVRKTKESGFEANEKNWRELLMTSVYGTAAGVDYTINKVRAAWQYTLLTLMIATVPAVGIFSYHWYQITHGKGVNLTEPMNFDGTFPDITRDSVVREAMEIFKDDARALEALKGIPSEQSTPANDRAIYQIGSSLVE
jgi:hypothetical protein